MTDLLVSGAYALQWWLVLAVIAAAARAALGSRWPAGDALAHAVGRWGTGVALTVAIWAVAHALPVFDPIVIRVSTLAAVAAFALAGAARRARGPLASGETFEECSARFLRAEASFALPFVAYLAMRGFNHDIYGLEKFMDFGFVNAALASPTMPPPDPWLAGATINYYYFGHVVAAFLIALTGVPPDGGST
jgi:uncharacterized membrane protein